MSKVLLVEDDNNLREIYEARLAAEGYDIITAQNGEEALVVAKQNHPDLIISDVMMPRISGFEMLDILRNTDELRETKVIMLTALGQSEDQARAGKLGADKYLVKSQVTLEDIVNSAKELLGEVPAATPAPTAADTPGIAAGPVAEQPAEAMQPENSQTAGAVAAEPLTPPPTPPQPAPDETPAPTPATDPSQQTSPSVSLPVMPVAEPNVSAAPVSVADPDPITPTLQIADTQQAVSPQLASDSTTPATPVDQTASATADTAQTTAAEEATVTSQINNFANTTPTVVAPVSVSAANDKVLAKAVDDLTEATSAPAEEVVPPSQKQVPAAVADQPSQVQPMVTPAPMPMPSAPATAPSPEAAPTPTTTSDNDLQAIAGKKVIQPISDLTRPGQNIDELLAKEEAKEEVETAALPVVNGAPVTPAPATNIGFDPNSIAL